MESLLALLPVLLLLACPLGMVAMGGAAWIWAKARRKPTNDERATLAAAVSES
jgi:hypothetical protein